MGAESDKIDYIEVTVAMKTAGLRELHERLMDNDLDYLVTSIYLAMEYERLDSLGQLSSLNNHRLNVGQGEQGNA